MSELTKARFTRMQDGTADEFALIEAGETRYARTLHVRVLDAVSRRSADPAGRPAARAVL